VAWSVSKVARRCLGNEAGDAFLKEQGERFFGP
jgi:hypothetical protein